MKRRSRFNGRSGLVGWGAAWGFMVSVVFAGTPEIRGEGAAATSQTGENLAFRVLEMESQVAVITEPVRQELRELLEEATSEVQRGRRARGLKVDAGRSRNAWRRDQVIEALRAIDGVLGRRGFLHPANDRVDLLSEGLTPRFLSVAERDSVMKLSRNARRAAPVEARFPGPFRTVDCDTAAVIYLGVGERVGLPLRMVFAPSWNRQRSHAWVRWGRGARQVDWETTQGNERREFPTGRDPGRGGSGTGSGRIGIELGREQVVGAWHYLLAVQHERRGEVAAMFRDLERALTAFPGHLDARRQLAWNSATLPGIPAVRVRAAVDHAREVVRLSGDADARDTLAAAYAADGRFDRATREARAALSDGEAADGARAGYRRRLALYEAGRAYRQPGRSDPVSAQASDPPDE